MNRNFKTTMIVAALAAFSFSMSATAAPANDPTKYDCRQIVGYKIVSPTPSNKAPRRQPIWACPHPDKMAAGKCQTHWLFGMRCTE
jgi:hypothetical protein